MWRQAEMRWPLVVLPPSGSGAQNDTCKQPGCSLRGVRWLQVVADGRMRQSIRTVADLHPVEHRAITGDAEGQGEPATIEQLSLPF